MSRPKFDVTVIERRQLIHRPASEIFAFFDRPANLKRVLPQTLSISLEDHPSDLRPGSLFQYRLRRWPVDLTWMVVVSDYRPPKGFTNVKAKGYFPRWAMEHELTPHELGSELRMRLSYEVPSGLYATLTNNYIIRQAMEELVSAQIEAVHHALEG